MHTLRSPEEIHSSYQKGLISFTDFHKYCQIVQNENQELFKASTSGPLSAQAVDRIKNDHWVEFERTIHQGRLQYRLKTNVQFIGPVKKENNVLNKAGKSSSFAPLKSQAAYEFHKRNRDLAIKAEEVYKLAKRNVGKK